MTAYSGPLECLVIPELTAVQAALKRLGKGTALQTALDSINVDVRYGLERVDRRPSDYINQMFCWEHTKQGSDFWAEIYNDLRRDHL